MKPKFTFTLLLATGLAFATEECPEKIVNANPVLDRTQFCGGFKSLLDSDYVLYVITIRKPTEPSDSAQQAGLHEIAEALFSTYDLRNASDSARLLPPSQGGPAGRNIGVEYDSILISKATATALSEEAYILLLKATFLPGSVSIPGSGCPDKIVNARPQYGGEEARTDSAACELFNSLADSQYALFHIRLIPPDTPEETWFDSAHTAQLRQTTESLLSTYDIRDYRDSGRLTLPFHGTHSDYSLGYAYYFTMMTKATAMVLRSEPYIKTLAFDPKLAEVSILPYSRSTHASSFTSHYGFDALGKIRRNPPRSEIRFHLPARY